MSFSSIEILILVVSLFLAWTTFYGLYRAFKTQQPGWAVAIVAGWIVGLGWLVGLLFLIGPSRAARRRGAAGDSAA